jgi:hypothetical protein
MDVSYKNGDFSIYGSLRDDGGIRNFLRILAISLGSSISTCGPFKKRLPEKPAA